MVKTLKQLTGFAGLGKKMPADIHRIILEKNRGAAGTSAPPQGLYLANIEYKKSIF